MTVKIAGLQNIEKIIGRFDWHLLSCKIDLEAHSLGQMNV
jgi:hypothetical protein